MRRTTTTSLSEADELPDPLMEAPEEDWERDIQYPPHDPAEDCDKYEDDSLRVEQEAASSAPPRFFPSYRPTGTMCVGFGYHEPEGDGEDEDEE